MNYSLKKSLLIGAGLTIIALPVAASQNMINLRGAFPMNVENSHQEYVSSDAQNCENVCYDWRQTRLQQQYSAPQTAQGYAHVQSLPQSTYVSTDTTSMGLRGLAAPYGVTYSAKAANQFQQDYARHMNMGGATIQLNPSHTERMLDWQENITGKTVSLLANRANGILPKNSLTLGGGFQGGFMWQKTDAPGQFPILSRFPFFSQSTDSEAGVFAINNAAMAITGSFGDWTTFYLQPEYSETNFPNDQDELQLRKAFVVLGNLEKTPFYAAFGRKTIDFGNFDSYNAFTQNEGQHYFWAASDQPVLELGYYNDGFKVSASAFSGGRQLRTAYAAENNNIANYAFNAEKEFLFGGSKALTFGGGYLHDTIYRNNWTAHTFRAITDGTPPDNFIEYRNSAVNGFVEYNSDFFDAMVEYTTTLEPWAAAIPQSADGVPLPEYLIDPNGSTTDLDNISFDQNLDVLVAQARIKPMLPNGKRLAIAAVGSWGGIADDFEGVGMAGQPTSWKENEQHALSLEYPVSPYLDFGVEYVYNKGFIPFVAPQQVSNDDTVAHAINVGLKARF